MHKILSMPSCGGCSYDCTEIRLHTAHDMLQKIAFTPAQESVNDVFVRSCSIQPILYMIDYRLSKLTKFGIRRDSKSSTELYNNTFGKYVFTCRLKVPSADRPTSMRFVAH